ncbi:protein GRAVITROPIC IN THE LIGHT 1 [Dendrobium catenatum]|nr:protein GRAVITROPIC IN THE LIGHT 1 [Dendrobium catenatum]
MTMAARATDGRDLRFHMPRCKDKQWRSPTSFTLRLEDRNRKEEIEQRKSEMADRVCNISDIIHRVASSCLTQPIAGAATRRFINGDDDDEQREEIDSDKRLGIWEEQEEEEEEEEHRGASMGLLEKLGETEAFMIEVFNVVSAVKKAYVGLQEAHCPWDPDRIRVADAGVVAELRKLVRLRDRFRRGVGVGAGPSGGGGGGRAPIREVVAPYEAALEDLRREIKVKEAEIANLKERLMGSGRAGRTHSTKRVGCISGLGSPAAPTPELFESCMDLVKSASKSFTAHLLSLMRAARWDLAAAARSIIDGGEESPTGDYPPPTYIPDVEPRHARHALESYVNRKLFHGFENETFYLEGSLTSLLRPSEFRRDCFSQFRDMRAMEPAELLGILPTCQFGRFAGKKYLSVLHPKMEESLFGGLEQRRAVIAGGHPRTGFYGEFLRVAKAVWLLHLLAFALDPAPSHFEASKGAQFHGEYMESVVRFAGGRTVPEGAVVGFSVAPGFKLGNGSVVRARVFVVPWEKASQGRGRPGV